MLDKDHYYAQEGSKYSWIIECKMLEGMMHTQYYVLRYCSMQQILNDGWLTNEPNVYSLVG